MAEVPNPKRKNELNRILAQSLFSRHSFSYSGIPLHLPNLLLPGPIEPDTEYLALPKPKSMQEVPQDLFKFKARQSPHMKECKGSESIQIAQRMTTIKEA